MLIRVTTKPHITSLMKKIVLITGATSGIGLSCARRFAENGDKLILTGRNEQKLKEIHDELTAKGTQVLTIPSVPPMSTRASSL